MRATLVLVATAMIVLNGCATTSSSTAIAPTGTAWEGPILVSQAGIPAGVEYKVVGSVQADAQAGYDGASSLYPLLAAEAKKLAEKTEKEKAKADAEAKKKAATAV